MHSQKGFPIAQGQSYAKLERVAAVVRKSLGLSPHQPISGVRLFESLRRLRIPHRGKFIRVEEAVSNSMLPGVEASAEYDRERKCLVITLSEQTYLDLEAGIPRALFSLCHEIGHVFLHVTELLQLSILPHRRLAFLRATDMDHPIYRDSEWQANAFAGALLIPAAGLASLEQQGALTSEQVELNFAVSGECAEVRLSIFRQRRGQLIT